MELNYGSFSFVWGASIPGDTFPTLLESLSYSKNLFEMKEKLVMRVPQWISLGINVVASDIEVNIAYFMLSSSPKRKNDYPHLG